MFMSLLAGLLVLALALFVVVERARYIPMLRALPASRLRRVVGHLALAFALSIISPLAALANEAPARLADSGWFANVWAYVSTPGAILWLIGLAMAILPQGQTGGAWDMLRTVLNILAANFGNAKNERKV
jgi:hypothetical protein